VLLEDKLVIIHDHYVTQTMKIHIEKTFETIAIINAFKLKYPKYKIQRNVCTLFIDVITYIAIIYGSL